jgi:hypothetical protein
VQFDSGQSLAIIGASDSSDRSKDKSDQKVMCIFNCLHGLYMCLFEKGFMIFCLIALYRLSAGLLKIGRLQEKAD